MANKIDFETRNSHNDGIAIIGMAGRFPGASSIGQYWENLCNGVESITLSSDEDLLEAGVDPSQRQNPNYVRAGGTIENADRFAASFFGFGAREAEIIDPQHRIFLECAWETFEDAGLDPAKYDGPIGVFAGCGLNTYSLLSLFPNPEVMASVGAYQIMVGNDKDFLATRVAYKLNLKGPAVNVQTACSTSLVAVQMACTSILRNECDMALAGGVSIHFPQKSGYLYTPGMILSPDGHCRAFDAKAAGTVPGRGAGVVLLKSLKKAIADRNHIYAVIRGAAINNDGAAKVGYSAPSVEGQKNVIAQSMKAAGFSPETVRYIEAHGTGTEVGDPIEVAALTAAFREGTDKKTFCAIGSVKTNIGHLDTAAGIAGLIKAALSAYHRTIPPTLHYQSPNPHIPFEESPFYVNTRLQRYDGDEPFRAGVSSFGIGGTNAHISLEEAPRIAASNDHRSQLIVLSARSAESLDKSTANLASYLKTNAKQYVAAIACTLQLGRRAFRHRRFMVAQSNDALGDLLGSPHSSQIRNGVAPDVVSQAAFLFPGQGSQYVNMGFGLYRSIATFRETIDECAELLKPHLKLDIRTLLYPSADDEERAEKLLHQTWLTQPALFAVEYAMAKTWMHCGIQPSAMIGHSIGEYVAACISGVFSLQDALGLLAERGRLIYALEPGAMLAVSLSEPDLSSLIDKEISIAACNSPRQCVVSGPVAAIQALERILAARHIPCRRLPASHAFHSSMLDPIVPTFIDRCKELKLSTPRVAFLSNLTGTWITPQEATDPAYWGAHLRNTVQFSKNLMQLLAMPDNVLLEVGPGETLLTFARQHPDAGTSRTLVPSMRQAQSKQDDYDLWLASMGRLWLTGVEPSWEQLHTEHRSRRISLPTYPFERERYWIEPSIQHKTGVQHGPVALSKKADIADWFYVPSWKRTFQALPSSETFGPNDVWLVLADEQNRPYLDLFRQNQLGPSIVVTRGERFQALSEERYQLAADNRSDWEHLFQHLLVKGLWPARVFYSVSSVLSPIHSNDPASFDRIFLSLMFLAQTISTISSNRNVQINVVAENACSVIGERTLQFAAAALPIACKVITLECPNISCRFIDLDSHENTEQLKRELLSDMTGQTVAYRRSTRWVDTYEPVHLQHQDAEAIRIVDGGTYLITGGLGGLGLTFAHYLTKNAGAHVILTSRSAFPPESEWDAFLSEKTTPRSMKERIQAIKRMRASCGKVTVVEADTCDLSRMREVLKQCGDEQGALRGIIHAAGLPAMSMIQAKNPAEALATLSPKTTGIRWIAECLESEHLDFVMLCSSISAVVPSYGLADYAAANAYMDAFANALDRPGGTRVISVNWDTWSEVGMAAKLASTQDERGMDGNAWSHAMTTIEGENVFERILRCPSFQIIVSTRDLGMLQDLARTAMSHGAVAEAENMVKAAARFHPRPETLQAYVEPTNEIEQAIAQIWQELLGVDRIGRHDNFFKLGGHSLLGTQVIARIRKQLALDLPLRTIFEAPTPAELAETLRALAWASGTNATTPILSFEREEIEL